MLGAGRGGGAEVAIAGHRIEQLVVDGRDQGVGELLAQRRELRAQFGAQIDQGEALQDGGQDGLDVGDDRAALFVDSARSFVFAAALREHGHFRFERRAVHDDFADDVGQVGVGSGADQPRRDGDQRAALLRDAERRRQRRHAAVVDLALDLADAAERNPAHDGGGERGRDRAGDAQIELGRDARSRAGEALERAGHNRAGSTSVSIG